MAFEADVRAACVTGACKGSLVHGLVTQRGVDRTNLQGCYVSVWVSNDWVIHNAVWCVCLNVLDPPAAHIPQDSSRDFL